MIIKTNIGNFEIINDFARYELMLDGKTIGKFYYFNDMITIIMNTMIDELNKRENEKLAKDESYREFRCEYSIVDNEVIVEGMGRDDRVCKSDDMFYLNRLLAN